MDEPKEDATTADTRRFLYALEQQHRAKSGDADGQCECGSYRLDGDPPVLHYPGCRHDSNP